MRLAILEQENPEAHQEYRQRQKDNMRKHWLKIKNDPVLYDRQKQKQRAKMQYSRDALKFTNPLLYEQKEIEKEMRIQLQGVKAEKGIELKKKKKKKSKIQDNMD